MLNLLDRQTVRALLHNALLKGLKPLNVTTILIADLPYGVDVIGQGVEEFTVDAVVVLKSRIIARKINRFLEIRKMRGVKVPLTEYPLTIGEGGIRIYNYPALEVTKGFRKELIPTGIAILDEMLGGGLPRGSATLVTGPPGAGKTILALNITVNNTKMGRKVLYVSFEEPAEQLLRCAKNLGCDMEKIKVIGVNPYAYTVIELLEKIRKLCVEEKPEIVVFDGLSTLMVALGIEEFLKFITYVIGCCRNRGVTFKGCIALNYPKERNPIETLVDNIIVLNLVETPLGLSRRLAIFKRRGALSDTAYKVMLLDEKGKVLLR